MAAYGALVSLMRILEQIQNHPRPPITLDKKQSESLGEKVCFLQEFLEHDPKPGCLESQIADVAYAAEDTIESYIVDQILEQSKSSGGSDLFYQDLQKVIEEMDLIKREVRKIQRKKETEDPNPTHSVSKVSSTDPSTKNASVVGIDDVINEVMDRLTEQRPARQILPIIGMGGSGKTTLARNIYDNPSVVHHFDIRIWVTISQEYSVREIILGALSCVRNKGSCSVSDGMSQTSEDPNDIGQQLYKSLWGRRYLVVLDDMWSIEAWERLKFFFPDGSTGSRIMITSRISDVVSHFGSYFFKMNFLDKDKSWDLLCRKVFAQESCPLELEEIGKRIAKNCKGLPLSIVVVGGLLANSEKTREKWEFIAENLYSIINLENNKHCSKILLLSYYSLPVHLKPCFLYFGVFPEDRSIRVSSLVNLWVAEGFLKPVKDKSLEMVARAYLNDLIGRNLVLVHTWGSSGSVKFCNIHDLLRDLCLLQAEKEKFISVTNLSRFQTLGDTCSRRRISIHEKSSDKECLRQVLHALQSGSPTIRSLYCDFDGVLESLNFKQLRILTAFDTNWDRGAEGEYIYDLENTFQLVNLRYLELVASGYHFTKFPSSIHFLWNLQTLIVKGSRGKGGKNTAAPPQIWDMPLLRHVEFNLLHLPDPLKNGCILINLQTLHGMKNFKFCEDVIKRIPNIKKLKIMYDSYPKRWSHSYCLNDLGSLDKLESFDCSFQKEDKLNHRIELLQNLKFPPALKKLSLTGTHLLWEDMEKIGSLPHLEVLKLGENSFHGTEWNTVEEGFLRLKFLRIECCYDLVYWTANNTHFPRLESLDLVDLTHLEEIPLDIGEIPTLRSIMLSECSYSAVISAKHILDEQESLGNMGLQVRVCTADADLMGLASDNFQVTKNNCNIM